MVDVSSAWEKHHRAEELLAELIELTDSYVARCEECVVHEASDGGRRHEWRIEGLEPLGTRWSLLAGDVAHNARTALDHAARALVVASGSTPGTQYFPLRREPQTRPLLEGASAAVEAAIEAEQPYRHHTGAQPALVVHELDRIDKHRMLLPAILAVRGSAWSAASSSDAVKAFNHEPLSDGAWLARFTYDHEVTEIRQRFDFEVHLAPDIDAETHHSSGFLRRGDPTRWGLGIGVHYIGQVLKRLERVAP